MDNITKKKVNILSIGIIGAVLLQIKKTKSIKKKQRLWIKKWVERRHNNRGLLSLVHNELSSEDHTSYKNCLRMNQECFEELLCLVTPLIQKQNTHLRKSISARERLTLTLRFLASGETYKNLEYSSRVPACTISKIIPECCTAIYTVLKTNYLKIPATEDDWNKIAKEFYLQWNFPNCIGALDGKHVSFEAAKSSGSAYWNYKHTNSIILLALVDAQYRFLYIDAGVNGRVSDGGVFRDSDLNKAIQKNTLNIPYDAALPNTTTKAPYVIVADAAFPLQNHIMKPYPQRNLSYQQRIFNYRLSRARRVVENAFGILVSRFRIFLTTIKLSPEKVENIILCCCALHNFLIQKNNLYLTNECLDKENNIGNIIDGVWRNNIPTNNLPTISLNNARPTSNALTIRQIYTTYFNEIGKVPWQEQCI